MSLSRLVMVRFLISLAILAILACGASAADAVAGPPTVQKGDWPWWRGPQANGVADPDQQPPLKWSATENVVWRTPFPGRGHSSPSVIGQRVILTTAEEDREVQALLCFDRASGQLAWRRDVHTGKMDRKGNKKTSQASSTVACDGERLFVNFVNDGAVWTTALDLNGKIVWQTKVADFATHQGFGSSPALWGDLVYVTTDSRGGGTVSALDRRTGKITWNQLRPEKANYASPVILNVAGKNQLLVSGCDLISSFDPRDGKRNWEVDGATTECVTTIVTDGQRVFVSGGYPRKHTQAVLGDGSGKTVWENTTQVYVPSMVVHRGHLFAVLDAGVATCWKCDTGEEVWKSRLGGTFSSSLVLVGENLYASNEEGQTFIFKADPAQFTLIGQNRLGDEVFATPTICGGRIYHRVAELVGTKRQEVLYCLGGATGK